MAKHDQTVLVLFYSYNYALFNLYDSLPLKSIWKQGPFNLDPAKPWACKESFCSKPNYLDPL